ncbi:MAG: hypothetical protein A3K65_03690 [Euryarchaeota archaeon RBG_16_68_12]|nr:MAG: hypothetical protein A3K65_03690 [Euryarchaeota archaeon RBG_16_68_12]
MSTGRGTRVWIFRSAGCAAARFRFWLTNPPVDHVPVSRKIPPGAASSSSPEANMIASPMSPPSFIVGVAGASQFPSVST